MMAVCIIILRRALMRNDASVSETMLYPCRTARARVPGPCSLRLRVRSWSASTQLFGLLLLFSLTMNMHAFIVADEIVDSSGPMNTRVAAKARRAPSFPQIACDGAF